MFPVSFSSNTGVSTLTTPIFDSAGQPAPGDEDDVSEANCCGVHVPNPEANEGLAVYPTGSARVVSFTFDVAIPEGFSQVCGTTRETFRPLEDSAERVVGATSTEGSKGTRSHSTLGVASVSAWDHSLGCSQESASIRAMCGSQLVGFDRNGLIGIFALSSPPSQGGLWLE